MVLRWCGRSDKGPMESTSNQTFAFIGFSEGDVARVHRFDIDLMFS